MSIDQALLQRISAATVAVGFLRGGPNSWRTDGFDALEIVGTGFVVDSDMLLTSRHVVATLINHRDNGGIPASCLRVAITAVTSNTKVDVVLAEVGVLAQVDNLELDLGIVQFERGKDIPESLQPLEVGEQCDARVSDEVLCLGYPGGSSAWRRKDQIGVPRTYRVGPVLQRGHISAIAPFSEAAIIERVLLDMRTEVGMSGGAVVSLRTGLVIGVHHTGVGAMAAFAMPLDRPLLTVILELAGRLKGLGPREWAEHKSVTLPTVRRAAD